MQANWCGVHQNERTNQPKRTNERTAYQVLDGSTVDALVDQSHAQILRVWRRGDCVEDNWFVSASTVSNMVDAMSVRTCVRTGALPHTNTHAHTHTHVRARAHVCMAGRGNNHAAASSKVIQLSRRSTTTYIYYPLVLNWTQAFHYSACTYLSSHVIESP